MASDFYDLRVVWGGDVEGLGSLAVCSDLESAIEEWFALREPIVGEIMDDEGDGEKARDCADADVIAEVDALIKEMKGEEDV